MKLETRPDSTNYTATVVQASNIRDVGLNTLHAINVFGFQALIGKDIQEGDFGLFFGPETQLSHEFASLNNLYRDKSKNFNSEKSGFFEDNRRVKAIKLGGQVSNGFFIPINSLFGLSIGGHYSELSVGDTFTGINGVEICQKYFVKPPVEAKERTAQARKKAQSRVDAKFFPLHPDTTQWMRESDKIEANEYITVTQKLHGTSVRISRTYVQVQHNWLERMLVKIGIAEYV